MRYKVHIKHSRLVQQVKDINSTKAEMNSITNKIQAEYDNLVAVRRLREGISEDMEKILMLMQAQQYAAITGVVDGELSSFVEVLVTW